MNWFYHNLIILIKLFKIPYKVLLVLRNQVFCLKMWKLWQAPTTLHFNIAYWNFAHVSYLPLSTKGCVGFFFTLFRSWVICKNQERLSFYTLLFCTFINNSRSKQNKNPAHPFVDITKQKMCAKFQQKNIKLCASLSSSKFLFFFRQKTWFLGNNRGLS